MRPDLDDYEDLNEADEAPRSRVMSWLVLSVAVGGFIALAYYAYHSGTQTTRDGDMLVIQADDTPIKAAPENPEGEQFANKDKTIYDVISPSANSGEGKVEKLLPEPERPVTAKDVEDDDVDALAASGGNTTTFVSKTLGGSGKQAADPVDAQAAKQPVAEKAPEPAPVVTEKKPEPEPAKAVVADATLAKPEPTKEVAKEEAKPEEKSIGAPTFINEKPAGAAKDAPVKTADKTDVKPVAKPEAKPAPKAEKTQKPAPLIAHGGSATIQLGSYQSEEEAQANWSKISGKFGSILSGDHTITKAELEKGTYYRLRVSGFADAAAAKAACAALSAKGQACIPVGK